MTAGRKHAALESSHGVLPVVIPAGDVPARAPGSDAATAASAAGVRALCAQLVAFYFRAPAKAFFRTRVDYLAYARTLHDARAQRAPPPSPAAALALARHAWCWLRGTTPGVLASAIRHDGWGVVPHQVLPPLLANVGVGAVLYTSYLQLLGRLHPGSARATRRVYPPPPPQHTFVAGFLAGGLQSVLAAPLDALQARYHHGDVVSRDGSGRRPRSMWSFGAEKLREIGLRGVFAGWGLSLAKDSLGCAVFFSVFECVKAQAYYRFVTWYYGGLARDAVDVLATRRPAAAAAVDDDSPRVIRPHYAMEPMFLLLAGTGASFAQQLVLHPLTHLQLKHWEHLEHLDAKAARYRGAPRPPDARWRMLRAHYRAYQDTWAGCAAEAAAERTSLRRWLYRGFWWNTIRQVPSTSAGLIIFELIRRKYGYGADEVRITKDGYDILLS